MKNTKVKSTEIVPAKGKPRGKPFTGVGDPRNNLLGRPKSGESLAEHIRELLDHPMKRAGTEEETNFLDAGLEALAKAFAAGDPDAVKLLLDRGYGKVPESIILSKFDQDDDEDLDALPLEALRLMEYWQWQAAGCPDPDAPINKNKPKIQKAITDSRILDRIRAISEYSPSLTDGEIEEK